MLPQMTEEQRAEARIKAAETKRLAQEYAKEHLKLNYEDENHWRELASDVGFRMPVWYEQFNTRRVKRLCKHLGKDTDWIKECWGVSTVNKIGKMNPDWTMFADCGLILEDYASEME